jgi:hypothetical protein
VLTALLALLLLLGACGKPTAQPLAPVLVIGIDGLEWSVLRPLLADGRCPNLAALMQRGAFGRLGSMVPTQSPIIWTTIATGVMPEKHLINGFVDRQGRAYTSTRRGVPALWNIADDYGLSSNVVGWWITWPTEDIRGVMVAASSSPDLVAETWKPSLVPGVGGQVHPAALTDAIMALAEEAGSLEAVRALATGRVFGTEGMDALDDRERRAVQQTLWSIQSDATFAAIAARVFAEHPADLNLVYFGGPDVSAHRFWRQYRPDDFSWSSTPEADAALSDVIPNYYEWVDELVGDVVAAMPADATVLVVSDHGMVALEAVQHRPPGNNESYVTGHHMDGEPGVIIAAGPGIRQQGDMDAFLAGGDVPVLARVTHVTPLVLALLGIPTARDFVDRRAPVDMLEGQGLENARGEPVSTHADGFRRPEIVLMPAEMRRNFVERFSALGYLDLADATEIEAELVNPETFGEQDEEDR